MEAGESAHLDSLNRSERIEVDGFSWDEMGWDGMGAAQSCDPVADLLPLRSARVCRACFEFSCAQLTRYYGSAVLGTKLWLVMEFVDGGSVLDFIKEKRAALEQRALRSLLPTAGGGGGSERSGSLADYDSAGSVAALGLEERYIAIIVREVLWALLFLESQKKFHRDLKAANVRRPAGHSWRARVGAGALTHAAPWLLAHIPVALCPCVCFSLLLSRASPHLRLSSPLPPFRSCCPARAAP